MNNFSNRLEILIKENKTKKKDLAAAIGMAASSITDMVKGRNNSTTPVIRAIASYYHVNPEWLEHGTGEIMEPQTEKYKTVNIDEIEARGFDLRPENYIQIPLYNALGSCGVGSINHNEHVESWLSFTKEYAKMTFGSSGSGLCCIRATGDSMQPTIYPGDLIVLDSAEAFIARDSSIYVLQMGDTTLVKRIQRLPGYKFLISSDNPTSWSKEMNMDDMDAGEFRVVGRVVFIGKLA